MSSSFGQVELSRSKSIASLATMLCSLLDSSYISLLEPAAPSVPLLAKIKPSGDSFLATILLGSVVTGLLRHSKALIWNVEGIAAPITVS